MSASSRLGSSKRASCPARRCERHAASEEESRFEEIRAGLAQSDARTRSRRDRRRCARGGRSSQVEEAHESCRRANLVAERHHLHRRNLKGQNQAHIRQRRRAQGSRRSFQCEPRWRNAPRHRYPRRRSDQREGVESPDQSRRSAECVQAPKSQEVQVGNHAALRQHDFVSIERSWV